MNFFSLPLFVFTLINFTLSNPLRDFSINNPREIIFDINKIKNEDFIVKKSKDLPIVLEFIPRHGKTINKIKVKENLIWQKFNKYIVSEIWVFSDIDRNLRYTINLVDEHGSMNIINCSNTGMVVEKPGTIEFMNQDLKFTMNVVSFSKFDLTSMFDYRFHKVKVYSSKDHKNKYLLVEPTKNNYFGAIYKGKTLVYKGHDNELVKKITLILKNDKMLLMNLKIKSYLNDELYFEYQNGNWINISQVKYKYMELKEIRFSGFTELIRDGQCEYTSIDLSDITAHRLCKETTHNFFNVQTIKIDVENLKKIKSGGCSTVFTDLRDVKVYLFRGVSSYDMMEIASNTYINKITGQVCKPENPLKKLTRNVNYYYIKIEDKWVRCTQKRFLERFKTIAKINIIDEINRLSKSQDGNQSKIGFIRYVYNLIDRIRLIPSEETYEIDEDVFIDGILDLKILYPDDSRAKSIPENLERSIVKLGSNLLGGMGEYTDDDLDDSKDESKKIPGSKDKLSDGISDPKLRKSKYNLLRKKKSNEAKTEDRFLSYSIMLTLVSFLIYL